MFSGGCAGTKVGGAVLLLSRPHPRCSAMRLPQNPKLTGMRA